MSQLIIGLRCAYILICYLSGMGEGKLLLSSLLLLSPGNYCCCCIYFRAPCQNHSPTQQQQQASLQSVPAPEALVQCELALSRLHCWGGRRCLGLPFRSVSPKPRSAKRARKTAPRPDSHSRATALDQLSPQPACTPGSRESPAHPPSSTWNSYRRGSFTHPDHVALVRGYTC